MIQFVDKTKFSVTQSGIYSITHNTQILGGINNIFKLSCYGPVGC